MGMINGTTIELCVRTETGTNEFNETLFTEEWVNVENVLISPTTAADVIDQNDLLGRRESYTLGIPKGDTHVWTNTRVRFWGREWRTYGAPLSGMENLIPLAWNTKITVESIE